MDEVIFLQTARGSDDPQPQIYQYRSNYTGMELLTYASFNLRIPIDQSNLIKFVDLQNKIRTVDLTKTLKDQGIVSGMSIFVLQPNDLKSIPFLPILPTSNDMNSNPADANSVMYMSNACYNSLSSISLIEPKIDNEALTNDFEELLKDDQIPVVTDYGEVKANDLYNLGYSDAEAKQIKLLTFYEFNEDQENPECSFQKTDSFDEVLRTALKFLSIDNNGKYVILLRFSKTEFKWFEPGHFLEEYNPYEKMKISIFRQEFSVKVYSLHCQSRLLHINITQTVDELIKSISKHLDLKSITGYVLKVKESGHFKKTLNPNQPIPFQTQKFEEIFIGKRYFIFSSLDLVDFKTLLCAYQDSHNYFLRKITYCHLNDLVKLTALSLIADETSGKEVDFSKLPDDISKYLPSSIQCTPLISQNVKEYFNENPKPSREDAMRLYIQCVRLVPGFGTFSYSYKQINAKTHGHEDSFKIVISPTRILLVQESGKVENELFYTKITSVDIDEHKVLIRYHKQGREIKEFCLRSKDAESIYLDIVETQKTIKQCIKEKIILRNKGKDSNEIILDEDKIILYTSSSMNEQSPKSYTYDITMTGEKLLQSAINNLKLSKGKEYTILIKCDDFADIRWIEKNEILANYHVDNGMNIYVIPRFTKVTIHLTDGTKKEIEIDVTKSVKDLVKETFEIFKINEVHGYTFFTMEKNSNIPLELLKTIPEQAKDYSNLLFKRRFFVLTRETIANNTILRQTYYDVKNYILDGDTDISKEQMFELATLSIYASNKGSDIKKQITNFDYKANFPKKIKVNSSLQTAFQKYAIQYKPLDEASAMRNYLRIAKDLPKFGAESYSVSFKILTKSKLKKQSKFKEGRLLICPLNLILTDSSNKEIFNISHQKIITYKSQPGKMILTYTDEKQKENKLGFKSDELNTIYQFLGETLQLLKDIILEEQRRNMKEKEDIVRRLNGKWIDEKGVLRTPMIDMQLSQDLKVRTHLKKMWFETRLTKQELLSKLIPALKLPTNKEYSLLVECGNRYRFLKNDCSILSLKPIRLSFIFLIESNPPVKIINNFLKCRQSGFLLLPIENTIKELIPTIARKFLVKSYYGHSLFYEDEKQELIPLRYSHTLPEQVQTFENLVFKRRFFIITKDDYIGNAISITYFDIYQHIISGNVDITPDELIELIVCSLIVDLNRSIKPEDIPKDLQQYIPNGMKSNSISSTKIKHSVQECKVKDKDKAMHRYIAISRSITTFGCEKYDGFLLTDFKGNSAHIPISILIGPNSLFIRDSNNKYLYTIPYDHYIGLLHIDQYITFRYISMNNEIKESCYLDVECKKSKILRDFLKTYISIKDDSFIRSAQNREKDSLSNYYRIELVAEYRFNHKAKPPKIMFDKRDLGSDIAIKTAKYLNLYPSGDYACLLEYSSDYKCWLGKDQMIGLLNPYQGKKLHIFEKLILFEITTISSFKRKVILDVTKKIKDLIPEIADLLFVDVWIGYSLFIQDNTKGLIPLNMEFSLGEQIESFDKLIFKRRFFNISKYDLNGPYVASSIYPDFFQQVMFGRYNISDVQALEHAYTSLFTSPSPKEEIQKRPLPSNISFLLPSGYTIKQNFINKLERLKSISPLETSVAMVKNITNAQQIKDFGCEIFQGILVHQLSQKKKEQIMISIGFKGIQMTSMTSKKVIIDFGFGQIYRMRHLKSRLLIQIPHVKEGELMDFMILSQRSEEMYFLINNYINIILPLIKNREEKQLMLKDIENRSLIGKKTIKLHVSHQINHPSPLMFTYDINETGHQIVEELKKFFLLDDSSFLTFLYKDSTSKIYCLDDKQEFISFNPSSNGKSFLVSMVPRVKVISQMNQIREEVIDLNDITEKNISNITKCFGLKFYECFTVKPIDGNHHSPMTLSKRLLDQTSFYSQLELKRRFFIFPEMIFEDDNSIESIYIDCKEMVFSGLCDISEEIALELAVYSIYASKNDSFWIRNSVFDDLSPLLPPNLTSSSRIVSRFKTLCRSILPMSPRAAQAKYIATVVPLSIYGMEIHDCGFSDLSKYQLKSRKTQIFLGPFNIQICDSLSSPILANFEYKDIISYSSDSISITIEYHNAEHEHKKIKLNMNYPDEIISYIDQMLIYLSRDDFLRTAQEIIDKLLGIVRKDSEFESKDVINILDKLNNSSFNVNDIDYDNSYNTDYRYDDNDFQCQPIDSPFDIYGSENKDDYMWRKSEEGLFNVRATRYVDALQNEIGYLNDHLDDLTVESFQEKLTFIQNILDKLANMNLTDEEKTIIENLRNILQNIIEKSTIFDDYESDMSMYKGIFTEKIAALFEEVGPLRKLLENDREFMSRNTINTLSHQEYVAPIVKGLVDASEGFEELGFSLLETNVKDKFSYIKGLETMSERLTALASIFAETGDTKLLQKIYNTLEKSKSEMNRVKKGLEKECIVNHKFNDTYDSLNKFITSLEQLVANVMEAKPYVNKFIYCGDQNALKDSVSTLLNIKDIFNELSSSLVTKNELMKAQLEIEETKSSIENSKNLFFKRYNTIMNNSFTPYYIDTMFSVQNSEVKSIKSYNALSNSKENASSQNKLNSLSKMLRFLSSSISAISTANLIPLRSSNIIEDLSMLFSRYESIENLDKKCSKEELTSILETLTILREINFSAEQYHVEFESHPLRGDLVRMLQNIYLKLFGILPQIQNITNILTKATKDSTFIVIYEKLQIDLNAALREKTPNEDISKCPHVLAFIQAQADAFAFINHSYILTSSKSVQEDEALYQSILKIIKQANATYYNIVSTREQLIEKPYSRLNIEKAISDILKLEKTLSLAESNTKFISDVSISVQYEQSITDLLKSIKNALELLKNTNPVIYRNIPSKQQINTFIQYTDKFINYLSEQVKDCKKDNKLEEEINFFSEQKISCENMNNSQLLSFYSIAQTTLEHIKGIPSDIELLKKFAGNNDFIKLLNDFCKFLEDILKPKVPTLEDAQAALQAIKPSAIEFLNQINTSFENVEIKNQENLQKEMQSWHSIMSEHINEVNSQLTNEFDYNKAIKCKNTLLDLIEKLPSIPISNKYTIPESEKIQLSIKLGSTYNKCQYAIACIRNLPSSQCVDFNSELFKKLDNEFEFEGAIKEIIQQYREFKRTINLSQELPQIKNRQSTLNLIKEMVKDLGDFDNTFEKYINNEEKLIIELQKCKEVLPKLSYPCELVSPIISVNKLPESFKILNQNVNSLQKYLSLPHFNTKSGQEFIKLIKDHLKNLSTLLSEQNLFDSLLQILLDSLKQIDSASTRCLQKMCDNIYSSTSLLLPEILSRQDLSNIIDEMFRVNEICSKYTSLAHKTIRFTNKLQLNSDIFNESEYDNITNLIYELLDDESLNVSSKLDESMNDYLSIINEHQESNPKHISWSSDVLCNCLTKQNPILYLDGYNTILSTERCFQSKIDRITKFNIKVDIVASKMLNLLKMTTNSIEQQFLSSQSSQKELYYLDLLTQSLDDVDSNFILHANSISSATMIYQSFHNIEKYLSLLIKEMKDNLSIKSLTQILFDNSILFVKWLNQADRSMSNLFYFLMDKLVIDLENYLHSSNNMNSDLNGFIRKVSFLLENSERILVYNVNNLSQLVTLLNETNKTIPKEIMDDLLPYFTLLSPVMEFWKISANEQEDNRFVTVSQSFLTKLFISPDTIKKNLLSSYSLFIKEFCTSKSKISILEAICKEIKSKDFSDIVSLISNYSNEITQKELLDETLNKSINNIDQLLNKLIDLAESKYSIDFSNLPSNNLDNLYKRAQSISSMINDKNCSEAAKSVLEYLKQLIAKIKSLPIINKNKDKKQLIYVLIPPYGKNSLKKSSNNVKIINENRNKFVKYNIDKTNLNLIGSFCSFLGSFKLLLLQQFQLSQFPSIIRELKQIKAIDITDNYYYLNNLEEQFQCIKDTAHLQKLLLSCNPKQIIVQQFLISKLIELSVNANYEKFGEEYDNIQLQYLNQIINNNKIESQDQLTIIQINNSIHMKAAYIRLTSQLIIILMSLLKNYPLIFKYIKTQETEMILSNDISSQLLNENQKLIEQQIFYIHYPDTLNCIQSNLSMEQIIIQFRIIYGYFKLLDQKAIQESNDAFSLLKSLNITQQNINNNNPSFLFNEEFLDLEKLMSIHDELNTMLIEYCICEKLFNKFILTNKVPNQKQFSQKELSTFVNKLLDNKEENISPDLSLAAFQILNIILTNNSKFNYKFDSLSYATIYGSQQIHDLENIDVYSTFSTIQIFNTFNSFLFSESYIRNTHSMLFLLKDSESNKDISDSNQIKDITDNLLRSIFYSNNDSNEIIKQATESNVQAYLKNELFIYDSSTLKKHISNVISKFNMLNHVTFSLMSTKEKYNVLSLNELDETIKQNNNKEDMQYMKQVKLASKLLSILKFLPSDKKDDSITSPKELYNMYLILCDLLQELNNNNIEKFITSLSKSEISKEYRFILIVAEKLIKEKDIFKGCPVNYSKIDQNVIINNIETPTERKILTSYAHKIVSLMQFLSMICQIPTNECQSLFDFQNTSTVKILKELINNNECIYTERIKNIFDSIPQLVSTLVRVLPTYKPEVKSLIIKQPITILPQFEKLLTSSIKSNDEEYKESLLEFTSILSTLKAVNSQSSEFTNKYVISKLIDITVSIDENNIQDICQNVIEIDAIKINSIATGKDITNIKPISDKILSIKHQLFKLFSLQKQTLPEDLLNSLSEIRKLLVETLKKNLINPFAVFNEAKSTKEIIKSLKKISSDISELSFNLSSNHQTDKIHTLSEILQSIWFSLALGSKAFSLCKVNSINLMNNLYIIPKNIVSTVKEIVDFTSQQSISKTLIKRKIRTFKRTINSLIDLVEDIETENISQATNSLLKQKLQFMENTCYTLQYILLISSTRALIPIADLFKYSINQEKEFENSISKMIESGNKALEMNKDEAKAQSFIQNFELLQTKIELFKKYCYEEENTQLSEITNYQNEISQIVFDCIQSVQLLTDISPLIPDLNSSSMLPSSYEISIVPYEKENVNIQSIYNNLKQIISQCNNESNTFINNSSRMNNIDIANYILNLISKVKEIHLNMSRISVSTMNLHIRSELASEIANLAQQITMIIKGTQDKFLLRGDWEIVIRNFSELRTTFEKILKLSEEASKIYIQESSTRDANSLIINNLVKELQDIDLIYSSVSQDINKMDSSINKEWVTQTLTVGSSLSKSIIKMLLYLKEHQQKEKIDQIIKFNKNFIEPLKEINNVIKQILEQKAEEPETLISKVMKTIHNIGIDFVKNCKFTNEENNNLKDGISSICNAAYSLSLTADESLESRKLNKQKQQKAQRGEMSSAAKDRLFKRLNLESRVIRARIILEKSEENLKKFF